MKRALALLATLACLRAMASPTCLVDDFYPTSRGGTDYVNHAVAEPWPEFVRDDEDAWFDLIEVGGRHESGWQSIYEVSMLRSDKGAFRVALLRARKGAQWNDRGEGVVDARPLPAALALRLHLAVMPILGRVHYAAELLEKGPPNRVECTDGETLYVTVANPGARFDELVGEARPYGKETEAGSVEALGHALRDYALGRIDEHGLEDPLERVEAHSKPNDEHPR